MKEEKVFATSGKKEANVRRETHAVSGIRVTITRKNQNTKPPHLLSHPCHEVEVCRGKEASEARSNHGAILRQPCRYYLKGTCTRSLCEYWHPPDCQFYKTGTGCKAGEKCLFPHHKVDEQPNKKPTKSYHSHKGRESDDKNAVATVKIVPQLGCVSQDSESLILKVANSPGGTRCKRVLGPIRRVRFTQSTLRQATTQENRTIAWKNTSQISSSAKSVRYEI